MSVINKHPSSTVHFDLPLPYFIYIQNEFTYHKVLIKRLVTLIGGNVCPVISVKCPGVFLSLSAILKESRGRTEQNRAFILVFFVGFGVTITFSLQEIINIHIISNIEHLHRPKITLNIV